MRVGGFRLVILAITLVLSALAPRTGHAAPERKNVVEKLAEDAAAAYKAGDYQRAVDLLERAYTTQPLTALLYNLAKAHDKLGNSDKARTFYLKYAAADDADPRLRARAEQRIVALRTATESPRTKEPATTTTTTTASTTEPPTPPPTKSEPRPTPRTSPTTEPTVLMTPTTVETPEDPLERERRARWRDRGLAITFGVIGVAALGAAIGMSVLALDVQHQFEQSLDEERKRSLRDDARTRALVADVLYPVGAVAVAVGAVFLWRGLRPVGPAPKRADKPTALLLPSVMPGGVGLVAGGRF
jgi:tetratricopeptide (TPR) repeat protein